MTVEELKYVAADLQAFANSEIERAKEIHGVNVTSYKVVVAIIQAVVKKIDDLKSKFVGMTNDEAKALAVKAVRQIIDYELMNKLGTVGKFIFGVLPDNYKDQLAGIIVDTVVSFVHNQVDKFPTK